MNIFNDPNSTEDIGTVTTSDSGHIDPEYQWEETVDVSDDESE